MPPLFRCPTPEIAQHQTCNIATLSVSYERLVTLLDLVQEVDFMLGGVHIDVDVPRIQFEGEVDEGMRALSDE